MNVRRLMFVGDPFVEFPRLKNVVASPLMQVE